MNPQIKAPVKLTVEMVAVKVAGEWKDANAICFDGTNSFFAKVAEDGKISGSWEAIYQEQCVWMAFVLYQGCRLEPGPAVERWRLHFVRAVDRPAVNASLAPASVSTEEACRMLGVCKETLRKIRKRKEIGFQKISQRKIVYYVTEINEYLAKRHAPRYAI